MNSGTKLRVVRIPNKFGGGFRFLQDDEEEFSILISESSRFEREWRVRFGKVTFDVVPESSNSDSWKSELRSVVWVEFSEIEWMDFIDENPSDDAMMFALEQKFKTSKKVGAVAEMPRSQVNKERKALSDLYFAGDDLYNATLDLESSKRGAAVAARRASEIGVSKKEIAKHLGVSINTVRKWVDGD